MLTVNDPATVAAVTAAFEAYEAALVANDVAALQAFFWQDERAVRFGATEQLYGHAAIAAFRQNRVVNFRHRRPLRCVVTTFGAEVATVMLEYVSDIDGRERHGRQSQTWMLGPDGWRIASAHISLIPATATADALEAGLSLAGLRPDPAWVPGIRRHFETTTALVAPLMDFALPETTEPAPVFQP